MSHYLQDIGYSPERSPYMERIIELYREIRELGLKREDCAKRLRDEVDKNLSLRQTMRWMADFERKVKLGIIPLYRVQPTIKRENIALTPEEKQEIEEDGLDQTIAQESQRQMQVRKIREDSIAIMYHKLKKIMNGNKFNKVTLREAKDLYQMIRAEEDSERKLMIEAAAEQRKRDSLAIFRDALLAGKLQMEDLLQLEKETLEAIKKTKLLG